MLDEEKAYFYDELHGAMLRAAGKLGIGGLLLRVVASELAPSSWLSDLSIKEEGDTVVGHTTHRCGSECPGTPEGCLTAYKVEETITRRRGRAHRIDSVVLGEGDVWVTLSPYL